MLPIDKVACTLAEKTKTQQKSHPELRWLFAVYQDIVVYSTMFIILFGTTITFLGCLPSSHLAASSCDIAAS